MARIRTIKPEFWEDEKLAKLPIPCRLLFIGTWTFADDFGCIKGNAALLKSQIFPYDENLRIREIEKWIDALVEARMLIPIIHNEESYYYIRTFRTHQVLDARYNKSYIGKDIADELINNVLQKHDVITTSSRREHDVGNGNNIKKDNNTSIIIQKKEKILLDLKKRKDEFKNECAPFVEIYGKDMMNNFFSYWTEPNKSKTKMKFELKETWDLSRRLSTWNKNNFDKNDYKTTTGKKVIVIDTDD